MTRQAIVLCLCFLLAGCSLDKPKRIEEEKYKNSVRRIFNAKTIKCFWRKGIGAEYRSGKINIKDARFADDSKKAFTIFDSIDIKNNKGRLIGPTGSGDVSIITTSVSVTFVDREIVPLGDKVTFITIFPDDLNENKFLCVMSAHSVMLDTPIPQQYYGTAEIYE